MQLDRRSSFEDFATSLLVAGLLTVAMIGCAGCVRELRADEPAAKPASVVDISDRIAAGGLVQLGEGEFTITRQVAPPNWNSLILTGVAPGKTRIIVAADIEGPLITLAGKLQTTGKIANFRWWKIQDLTLSGFGTSATALEINDSSMGRMERVVIEDFAGGAIKAHRWWDTLLTDCHFVRSGTLVLGEDGTPDAAQSIPCVWLQPANSPIPSDPREGNCNNLKFVGCRWEQNPYTSLVLGQYARVNSFVACKWHGILPKPAFGDHVVLDGAEDNSFVACNLTNCGGTSVIQRGCFDNDFPGTHIGNSRVAGMRVDGSRFNPAGITWSKQGGPSKVNLIVDGKTAIK